jgi:hypothetical protein
MRLSLIVAAPLLVLLATGGVQAAASPTEINGVLANCPGSAGDCDTAVTDFANGLPSADRDSDLLTLANALAAKAAGSPEMCGELRASIQVAADAASSGNARDQIAGVAPLCDDVDMTFTGSIARQNTYVVPQSLITQPDPDDAKK